MTAIRLALDAQRTVVYDGQVFGVWAVIVTVRGVSVTHVPTGRALVSLGQANYGRLWELAHRLGELHPAWHEDAVFYDSLPPDERIINIVTEVTGIVTEEDG